MSGPVQYKNKYEAAKEYDNGVRCALFGDRFKLEYQTPPLFSIGYRFGRSIKDLFFQNRNESLKVFGFDETTQEDALSVREKP